GRGDDAIIGAHHGSAKPANAVNTVVLGLCQGRPRRLPTSSGGPGQRSAWSGVPTRLHAVRRSATALVSIADERGRRGTRSRDRGERLLWDRHGHSLAPERIRGFRVARAVAGAGRHVA